MKEGLRVLCFSLWEINSGQHGSLFFWAQDWKWKQTGSASWKQPECQEITCSFLNVLEFCSYSLFYFRLLESFSTSWDYGYQVWNAFMLNYRLQTELCSKLHCTAMGVTEFSVEQRQDLQDRKTMDAVHVGAYWTQVLYTQHCGRCTGHHEDSLDPVLALTGFTTVGKMDSSEHGE